MTVWHRPGNARPLGGEGMPHPARPAPHHSATAPAGRASPRPARPARAVLVVLAPGSGIRFRSAPCRLLGQPRAAREPAGRAARLARALAAASGRAGAAPAGRRLDTGRGQRGTSRRPAVSPTGRWSRTRAIPARMRTVASGKVSRAACPRPGTPQIYGASTCDFSWASRC